MSQTSTKQAIDIGIGDFKSFTATLSALLDEKEQVWKELRKLDRVLAEQLTAEQDVNAELLGARFCLRYAPSCQVLQFCTDRPVISAPSRICTATG